MATLLKQSTAVTIRLGPFLDSTDGVTEETALGSMGVEVSKNHGAFAARNSATATAHDAEGWYSCALDTTDTGTLGPLTVKAHASATHLPVWREFIVVPANVYDSLVAGSDVLTADVTQFNGTAGTFAAGRPEVNTSHVAGTAQTAGDVIADTNDIQTRLPAALVGGRLAANAEVVGDKTGYTLSQSFPTNFASLSIDGSGRVDIAKWLGSTVNALIAGRVDANAQVVGDKTSYALTAAERTSIANALLDLAAAIDGKTPRQALRYIAATTAGKNASGLPNVFLGLDGATTRVTGTVNATTKERTAVSYD